MSTRRLFIPRAAVTVAAVLGLVAAGCASRGQQSVGEYVDDAAITTRVKTRLIEDDIIRAFQLRVDTLASVVRLTGTVKTKAQSERAADIARAANGVKDVRNEIVVSP
jgi:hyperosmotically inducible periplasmic protein